MYFYDQSNTNFAENRESVHYKNLSNEYYQSTAAFNPNDDTVEPQESPIDFLNNNNLQLDTNHLFSESCLFEPGSHGSWDHQQQALDSTQQEAILLSDPNFLRQHQLLRDQQQNQQQQEEEVSDLTAMLEPHKQENQTKKKPSRRQNAAGKGVEDHHHRIDDSDETKIDHQRRFNELQARFRVNYAPKPSQSKGKSAKKHPISPQPHATTAKRASIGGKSCKEDASSPPIKLEHVPSRTEDQQKPPAPSAVGGLVMNTNNNNHMEDSFPSKEPASAAVAATTTTTTTTTAAAAAATVPARTLPIQIQRVTRPNSNQPFDAESHQRQLDNQLTKVDFDDITVSELKEMLRQRGKPATGKKAILLQRLQEERDLAKGGRSPGSNRVANRHSQPLPFSRSLNLPEAPKQQRPRSFQGGGGGSSPVAIKMDGGSAYHSAASSASPSMPSFLPPGSPGGQLNRSIANMHIGSPPATSSTRRYSPYSPRLSSSPKTTQHEYSSSVPLYSGDLPLSSSSSLSPGNTQSLGHNGNGMMLSSSYSARPAPSRYYNNPKTYKPFTSSTLATPDREEDVNPFDSYYANVRSPITEEKISSGSGSNYSHPLDTSSSAMNNLDSMDWSDPSALELLLQQGTYNMNIAEMIGQPLYSDDVVLTNEQIMALLNTQQAAPPFEFKLSEASFTPDQPLFQQQQQQQQQHYS
ncbi:hypothetical protein [Parasitella parasitica]|uniref:SAP domain-containing protein n=1 Tax=Parasitella parasitica TaxID=35722 RepID=A0A0B7N0H7_9FUNG|nr:hypothetical protein [Parasitella parasitica]